MSADAPSRYGGGLAELRRYADCRFLFHVRRPSGVFPALLLSGLTRLEILGRSSKCRLAIFCMLLAGLLPFSAPAQTTEPLLPVPTPPSGPQAPAAPGQPIYPSQTVTQRPRPDLDPLGLHVGDFFWFPRAELGEAYNSNIFATPSPTYDLITALQPGFDLVSSLPQNAINLHGGAALQFYADHPAQNTQNGFVNADGRLDVSAGSALYGNAQAAHLSLPRTSPNSPGNAAEPVTYNNYAANVGYRQTGLRFGYQADVAVQNTQYNAVPAVGGGTLSQSSQDTTISQAALRGSYELVQDYLGYIRVAGDLYDYWHTVPGGVRFNSTVYRADLGLQMLPRHIVYGEIYAGYLIQNFALSSLGSFSTPDAGGRLTWNVTRVTTFTFAGIRTFQTSNPSVGVTGAGYLDSAATVNIDHELWHNLLLNANAGYENDTYRGISRNDNIFSTGAGFKYLVNRNLYLGGSYSFQQRNSSGTSAGIPFTQSILMLRLSTQF
jgi:hypothetical protein